MIQDRFIIPAFRSNSTILSKIIGNPLAWERSFTSDANEPARTTEQRVTLIDRDKFIDLLIEHYAELEPEYQATVPLKPVYIPTQDLPLEE